MLTVCLQRVDIFDSGEIQQGVLCLKLLKTVRNPADSVTPQVRFWIHSEERRQCDQGMPRSVVYEINDYAIFLQKLDPLLPGRQQVVNSVRQSRPAADDLTVQRFALCRTRHQYAADVRIIVSFSQQGAIR